MKKKRRKLKKVTVHMPTGETVTAANIYAGDIVWYHTSKKTFVQTTVDWMKRWFR